MKLIAAFILLAPIFAGEYSSYIGDTRRGTPVPVGQTPIADVVVTAMATDAAGNTYLTGSRISVDPATYRSNAPMFAFATKVNANGQVVFTKVFGGNGSDQGTAIALDPAGDIYIAGTTTSTDFLLSSPLQTNPGSGFIIKLSPDGNTILYSTYFGGVLGKTSIAGLATDTKGNLYLTGTTDATDFPTTAGTPSSSVNIFRYGAFFTEIGAAGDKILYSGIVVGTAVPCPPFTFCGDVQAVTSGIAIAVDASGNAYVAGNSNTTDLPTTQGSLAMLSFGAFVVKIKSGGAGFAYFTYLGSATSIFLYSPATVLHTIAVDSAGNAYLAGATNDPKFPATPGAYQTMLGIGSGGSQNLSLTDAFAAKLAPDGSKMVWATYVGGTGADTAQSMAVDASGNVWISGTTTSTDFPNANGWSSGGDFLAEISSSGAALSYAARYPNETVGQAVGVDSTTGLVHVAGSAGIIAGIAPGKAPTMRVFGITNSAGSETTGRVAIGEAVSIYGPHIGPMTAVTATLDSQGALPTSLGGVQVSFGGTNVPLLYVSDGQINALVPGLNNPAAVRITNGSTTSPDFPLVVIEALPQVFRSADGFALALNEDGSLNSMQNPAKIGSVMSIWATGIGDLQLPVGQLTVKAANSCSECIVNVYGNELPGPITQPAPVLYAGPAPGLVSGFFQINFRLEFGSLLNLEVNGYSSEPFQVHGTN